MARSDTKDSGRERQLLPFHERLLEAAEERREKEEKERVHCPECDTTVWKDTIEEAVETAEQHEESRHDGEQMVEVNGLLLPSFSEEEKEQIRESVRSLHTE